MHHYQSKAAFSARLVLDHLATQVILRARYSRCYHGHAPIEEPLKHALNKDASHSSTTRCKRCGWRHVLHHLHGRICVQVEHVDRTLVNMFDLKSTVAAQGNAHAAVNHYERHGTGLNGASVHSSPLQRADQRLPVLRRRAVLKPHQHPQPCLDRHCGTIISIMW